MPKGVVLNLGGAPKTWHVVAGLSGLFHPDKPVPVYEGADSHSKDPGCPVKVVDCKKADLDASVKELGEIRPDLMRALRSERDVAPVEQVETVLDAVTDNRESKE